MIIMQKKTFIQIKNTHAKYVDSVSKKIPISTTWKKNIIYMVATNVENPID